MLKYGKFCRHFRLKKTEVIDIEVMSFHDHDVSCALCKVSNAVANVDVNIFSFQHHMMLKTGTQKKTKKNKAN